MAYLFPHTAVPPSARDTLLEPFEKVIILQPTKETLKPVSGQTGTNRRLRIECPFETGHEQVRSGVAAYTRWAEQHEGTDLQQVKFQTDTPLFFDEESSYRLESLLRPSEGKEPPSAGFDPEQELLKSRIFLSLAQAHDIRSWEIAANFDQVEVSQSRLFAQLHGKSSQPDDPIKRDDRLHGGYMVRERMAAWSSYLTQLKALPDIFVTLFPEVKALIEEALPTRDLFCTKGWVALSDDASAMSQWRNRFKEILDFWLLHPARNQHVSGLLLKERPRHQKSVHLSICRIRQSNPVVWLGGPDLLRDLAEAANSIVVLVNKEGGTF